ncbi:hypothetical protein GGE07_006277 [Sinorhizobium terangae]|nr:hypothetical protein [Sinorhizobium terangae]
MSPRWSTARAANRVMIKNATRRFSKNIRRAALAHSPITADQLVFEHKVDEPGAVLN